MVLSAYWAMRSFCEKSDPTTNREDSQVYLNYSEVRRRKTKLNAVSEYGHDRNCPVQVSIGHGILWCRGLMTGLLRWNRHLPAPLIRTKISVIYWREGLSVRL